MELPRIIFMGTPPFAVASLKALLDNQFNVVAVVTAPDRLAGRGMELQESAVKIFAKEKKIPVLQPVKLRDEEFLTELQNFKADIQVVVAFRMLPQVVWDMPPLGTINVHGSLLPQYRGAAPINWAIINGEKNTGVTTFKLKHEIDTGNILMQQSMPIGEEENAGDIHDRMKELGAQLLVTTLYSVINGSIKEQPQSNALEIKHAPKIDTDTCRLNFKQPISVIYNHIRGLSPYPAAFTILDDKVFKIFASSKEEKNYEEIDYSDMLTDGKTYLKFKCMDGYIHATEVQLQGKKRMKIEEFLRGYRFKQSL